MPELSPFIKELKKAGEDLKRAESNNPSPKFGGRQVEQKIDLRDYNPPTASEEPAKGRRVAGGSESHAEGVGPSKTPQDSSNWILPQDYQKEILQEKQKLEKAYKEVESFQRRIQEKLKMINELESQNEKLNKELKQLQQKIVLVKKENNNILYQVKEINEHRTGDLKKDLEE